MCRLCLSLAAATLLLASGDSTTLQKARDAQDRAALDRLIAQLKQQAEQAQQAADRQYQLALAYSYAAEVAIEVKDKSRAQQLAEAGMEPAHKAIALKPTDAEYHRLLGELCGQVIPANPLFGLKYGQCARDEITKALQLNGRLAMAYVSRGVGNYYLPPQFGGGIELALKDFDQAIALDPKLADAYLWKGIALRKANRNNESRQALASAVQLDPGRIWAKQQLDKTPAR